MSASAPAPRFGLWDVLDLALEDTPPRALGLERLSSSSGGIWGDPDMKKYALTRTLRATGASLDSALGRMFETDLGSRLAHLIGSPERALTALERLGLETVAETLRQTGEAKDADRMILVPRGIDRPPVILLMSSRVPTHAPAQVISDLPYLPFTILRTAMANIADPAEDFPEAIALREILYSTSPFGRDMSIVEVFLISQPEIVLTRRPRMIPLCVSLPHIRMEAGANISTAGVFCRDSAGDIGITGCFHGTGPEGTKVMVDLRTCQVTRANQVQDIVFIPLDDGFNVPQMAGLAGIRTHREPARADRVHFDGAVNSNQHTRILGCDNGLLRARPTVQLKVQTDPDTDCGDSGCALLDENDQVIGFAFERTDYDDYPQFTDWIWASNALRALELTPLK
jgi:hypothetical protein